MVRKREEKVLLYRFPKGERLETMQVLLQTLGIKSHVLPDEAAAEKIGYLLGLTGFQKNSGQVEEFLFPHEVIIFYQVQNRRLDQVLEAFRDAGIPRVHYKAVVTPLNRFWSLRRLCETMEREHSYITQRRERA